jgi:hypothetical protein
MNRLLQRSIVLVTLSICILVMGTAIVGAQEPGNSEPAPQMVPTDLLPPDSAEFDAVLSGKPTPAPEAIFDVKATPVEDGISNFMVKWKTAVPAKGWIEYGTGVDHLDQVAYPVDVHPVSCCVRIYAIGCKEAYS